MKDIAPELLEGIRSSFNNRISGDKNIAAFMKKVQEGNASLEELSLYGRMLGDHLADALLEHITQEALPDETLYFNIASRIIDAVMHDNYNLVNEAATRVQESIDEAAGIGLNAVKAPYPEERVMGVINGLSQKTAAWEVIRGRMDEPIRNISQALVDDFIRANADFRHKAGMKTYIVRKAMGKCCEWCGNLAGSYAYPEDIPDDVFRRHDDCRCTVVYKTDKGIQNVWTKKWNDPADRAALEERKRVGNYISAKEARIERAKKMAAAESEQKEAERQKRIATWQGKKEEKTKGGKAGKAVEKSSGSGIIKAEAASRYLNTSEDIYRYAQKVKPIDGYEDMFIHGDKTGFSIRDLDNKEHDWYTPREFAEILRKDPNYQGGNIRLLSCEAGAEGAIVAQFLANQLGVEVLAPSDILWIHFDGMLTIGPDEFTNNGKWIQFSPKR